MRFPLIPTVAALFGFSAVTAAPSKRSGGITQPADGTSVSTGDSIPFQYNDGNWCHEGYTPITIWLSESAPTGLNATGQLPEGTYIDYFGEYLNANFGLPPDSGTFRLSFEHHHPRYLRLLRRFSAIPLGCGDRPGGPVSTGSCSFALCSAKD
ncbi:hypothetical protein MVEN_02357200 [Mycena venus]|uniref:Uncharacterized protein n=1 Tax=Mycena venus TaxID=2733690 RepID=A0A8H7CDC8_9AGAR|nr:hypothetical protein MVEN_02357200 [Mycena venus]